MAMWHVKLDVVKIWSLHCHVLVQIGNAGMLFRGGYYPVLQMLNQTELDGMKHIGYNLLGGESDLIFLKTP
jgi:hypothetical protein